jgi:transposase-like protein
MRPHIGCPFCLSIHFTLVDRSAPIATFECGSCRKRWDEVTTGVEAITHLRRPAPAKTPLRCARCDTEHSITIERHVTGSDVHDVYVCSQCEGTWPVRAGGKKTA